MNFSFDFPIFTFDTQSNGLTSATLCCDYCRGKLGFRVHRYWHMRFCSMVCMNTYRQRLSPDTQQKITQLDVHRPLWKMAS